MAWASYQRSEDETPYWRTLKANGELNAKYPNGVEAQKKKLEAEGHTIIQRGRKNIRYYVQDYENFLFIWIIEIISMAIIAVEKRQCIFITVHTYKITGIIKL